MFQENYKSAVISMYKLLTYILIWFVFLIIMQRVNYALLLPTRTAALTMSSFFLVILMLQKVYGNFEIGLKKSKPVFLTTMISVIIADLVALLTLLIMGINQFMISDIILKSLGHLAIAYVIQGIVIWVMAHAGNNLYFRLYVPSRSVIINNEDLIYSKICDYVNDHDKQFTLMDVYKIDEFGSLDIDLALTEIDTIFALGLNAFDEKLLIDHCYKNKKKLLCNADTYDFQGHESTVVIDDVLLKEYYPKEITLMQMFIKRIMDIVGSLVLLILTSPIILVTAIIVKADDGGPIFFSQERLTKNGKVFRIYKFRSMKMDSGDKPAEVDDDRITKVGHVIRKLRIDELPQAINILRGDISLVGPRPESVAHAESIRKELPEFDLRLRVKGGLTGYAQIFGKYNTTPKMKLLLDLEYIERFSIIEDLKLILQTLTVFVRTDSTEGFSEDDI